MLFRLSMAIFIATTLPSVTILLFFIASHMPSGSEAAHARRDTTAPAWLHVTKEHVQGLEGIPLGFNDKANHRNRCLKQPLAHAMNDKYVDSVIATVQGFTIVTAERRRATAYLTISALSSVDGDIAELGIFKGSTSIIILKLLQDLDKCNKRLHAFDSFQGLPETVAADAVGSAQRGNRGDFLAGLDVFEGNLQATLGWRTNPSLIVYPGWFNETTPAIRTHKIAFLRLDGDLFASTWDAIINLYDLVVPGGWIYVDDYLSFNGCKVAIDMFRTLRRVSEPLHYIKEANSLIEAVYWRKAGY